MPLPPNYKAQASERIEYDPIAEGVYQVEITDINEITQAKYKQPTETETLLKFEFTVLTLGEALGRKLWKRVRPTINAGSDNYRPSYLDTIMTKALKRNLTEQEAQAIEINALMNKQLVITVDQKPGSDGKVYNNIQAFTVASTLLDPIDKSTPDEVPPAPSVVPQPAASAEDEINLDEIFPPEAQ